MASGLIAGGAIMEVLVSFTGAVDKFATWKVLKPIQRISEGVTEMTEGAEVFVGKIMPFLDLSGRWLDGGGDPGRLARIENWVGLILFLALCLFVYFDCRRAKPELGAGELG